MTLRLTVLAGDAESEEYWANELASSVSAIGGADVRPFGSAPDPGQIVFVDGSSEPALGALDDRLKRLDAHGGRRGRAVFLILRDGSRLPQALLDGRVDDVLIHPFRPLEVLGRVLHYQRMLAWDEVSALNASFGELIEKLHEDVALSERLQKARLPVRFPEAKGFKFASRYLAGVRSGGDYFDLAEARSGAQLSILMSDSSSYGLSSAVLSVLMRVAVKLSADESRSCRDTVRKIHSEILAAMRETDQLSLFYGVISRRDHRLRYINLGNSCAFHSPAGGGFGPLPSQSGPITRSSGIARAEEAELPLRAGDRLALISDGFVEAAGGPVELCRLLDSLRSRESVDTANELAFRVKSRLQGPDDLPAQDCSALLIDLDSKLIQVA